MLRRQAAQAFCRRQNLDAGCTLSIRQIRFLQVSADRFGPRTDPGGIVSGLRELGYTVELMP